MINGAPNGSLGLATQSEWMNSELFAKVLEHLIEHMAASVTKREVLVMDNHERNGARIGVVYCHVPPTLQSLNAALTRRSIWAH